MIKAILKHPLRFFMTLSGLLSVITPAIGIKFPQAIYWLDIARDICTYLGCGAVAKYSIRKGQNEV